LHRCLILYWCYLWNENSVQFRIIYSIDNLFIWGRSFYIKCQSWGRELNTVENKREQGRECECRETTRRTSVWNPVVWEKHVFTRKGKNASGDRLRLIRNMRKIDNVVSHRFDLQMFLTVSDISRDGQFIFSDTNTLCSIGAFSRWPLQLNFYFCFIENFCSLPNNRILTLAFLHRRGDIIKLFCHRQQS